MRALKPDTEDAEPLRGGIAPDALALAKALARLRDCAETGVDFVWEADSEGRLTYAVAMRERDDSVDVDAWIGLTHFEIAQANADDPVWLEHLGALRARRPFMDLRYGVHTCAGRTLSLSVSGKPFSDSVGRFAGWRGSASEVTLMVEAERQARAAENRGGLGYWRYDLESGQLSWSNQMYRIHGRAPGNYSPEFEHMLESFSEEDRGRLRGAFERALQGAEAVEERGRLILPDGSFRWVEITAESEVGSEEKPLALFGILRDVTDPVEQELALDCVEKMRQQTNALAEGLRRAIDEHAVLATLDATGRLVDANRNFCDLNGVPADHVVGSMIEEFLAPEDPRRSLRDLVSGAVSRDPARVELRNAQKLARPYVLDATIMPLPGPAGWSRSVVIIGTDVTAARASETRLRESEQRWRELVLRTPAPLMVFSGSEVLFANEAFAKMLGYAEAKQMLGLTLGDLNIAEDHPIAAERFDVALGGRQDLPPCEAQMRCADGTVKIVEVAGTPIEYRDHPAVFVRAHDVTERAESERLLQETLEVARRANHAKTQFLATMSHELRTPLNAVIGFADVMESETFGPLGHERYCEYVQDIKKSGQHLLALLSDMLDLSRIEAGRYEATIQTLDLVAVVRDSQSLLNAIARERGHPLEVELPGVALALGDLRAIRQILINLVSNSAKYSERRQPIRINVEAKKDQWVLTVVDRGDGISMKEIDRLMKPFERSGDAMTSRESGVGLGLPICRRLAEMQGGSLTIESEIGQGTTVRLLLPKAG